jgi:acetyltransferase (GNAT) family protein
LNEEWITGYFTLEEKDIETLGDQENAILRKGSHIFMVYLNAKPVGCVALIPIGAGVLNCQRWPSLRGRGIGLRLIEYTICRARMLWASS